MFDDVELPWAFTPMMMVVVGLIGLIICIFWTAICANMYPALNNAYNQTTPTAAGQALKAPEIWANTYNIGWILEFLYLGGCCAFLIVKALKRYYQSQTYQR